MKPARQAAPETGCGRRRLVGAALPPAPRFAVVAALALLGSLASGQPRAGSATPSGVQQQFKSGAAGATPPLLVVQKSELENGLKVVLHVDHGFAQIAVCTVYGAGTSRATLRPGAAALVYQMLREGGRSTDGAEYSRKVEARGGRIENTLTADYASYCTLVPKHELALALWLEAGRMTNYAFNAQNFERRSDELKGAFLESVVGAPYAGGERRLGQIAFQGYAPYERSVLPDPDELDALSLEDVSSFHTDFYRSNNAVLSIAGDFDALTVLDSIRELLGAPAFMGAIPEPDRALVPRQTSPRLSVVIDPVVKNSAVFYGWVVPGSSARDYAALQVTNALVALGDGSRLSRELVQVRHLAISVAGLMTGNAGLDLFGVQVRANEAGRLDVIEQALSGVLTQLAHGVPPSSAELDAAKSRLKHERYRELSTNLGKARYMAAREFLFHDSEQLESEMARIESVDPSDVRRVVMEQLTPQRRTSVEIYPKEWNDPNQAVMPRFHVVSSGENLTIIAKRYGTTAAAIAKMNGVAEKKPIFPGQKLRVPRALVSKAGARGKARSEAPSQKPRQKQAIAYTVRRGDSLSTIAAKHKVSVSAVLRANNINPKKPLQIGQRLAIPVPP